MYSTGIFLEGLRTTTKTLSENLICGSRFESWTSGIRSASAALSVATLDADMVGGVTC